MEGITKKNRILKLFSSDHSRTVKARKNILASLLIKGFSIVIGFLIVPITLSYLDQTRYGIWITISSFLTWFTFFEIGLGHGLRNKLAEALARNDLKLGRTYVSTTYAILTIIISIVLIIFVISNQFIDWTVILNTEKDLLNDLTLLSYIVFCFFFLTFVLKLIGIILTADQRPAINNLFGPLGNLLALIIIYILTKTTSGSIIYLGLALSISPVIILVIATVYFYRTDYKSIAPSIKFIDFAYAKVLLNLGIKFFIIQVSGLVILNTSNIIIAQFFGPAQVTPYNIAFKYFSLVNMAFTIIIVPFWSAFTEAWVKKDFTWITSTINILLKIWIGFFVVSILLYIFSDTFFNFWIGKEEMKTIIISNSLKISLIIYFLSTTFGGIFNMFINGIGKIQIQMWTRLSGAILFIPIAIILIKYFQFGIEGVIYAKIISNFFGPLVAPIQYYKIINAKATGIWNK